MIKSIVIFLSLYFIIFMQNSYACLEEDYAKLSAKCEASNNHHEIVRFFSGKLEKTRHIAVIAGVSEYSKLTESKQLPEASYDIENMKNIFIKKLLFDEVIILKNSDFNRDNLSYIFQIYLPSIAQKNPKTKVVFTFSGHGDEYEDSGYLFFGDTDTINIEKFEDAKNSIQLNTLKGYMQTTIKHSQHFLALLNSCKGGHFLDQTNSFGESSMDERGSHGITAGGADDYVYARPNVGSGKGSVFFEMVAAAFTQSSINLNGTVFKPNIDDGILTTNELNDFLFNTIKVIENGKVLPRSGRLEPAKKGNLGEMFFVIDEKKAQESLKERFPKIYKQIFGQGEGDIDVKFSGVQEKTDQNDNLAATYHYCDYLASGGNADSWLKTRVKILHPQTAIKFCESAVSLHPNILRFQYQLARAHSYDSNYSKSYDLLTQLAELDYPPAMNNLGYMYQKGLGVAQDYDKASELYQQAINLGNASAMNNLGYMYDEGLGVEQDYDKASELYQQAINLGNASAMNNLGYMYDEGLGVEQDYNKASELYQQATNLGEPSAMYNLGTMYLRGFGVEQDYDKAKELYQQAINLSEPSAMYNLGTMYRNGLGVEQDYDKAVELYQQAINLSEPSAMAGLGYMYGEGLGVGKDNKLAYQYSFMAEYLGNNTAKENLKFYEKKLSQSLINEARKKGLSWLKDKGLTK